MRIGALAEAAGVSVDTVRYYEKEGLMRPPWRTPGGLRDYGAEAVQRLRAIGRAKALGFSLAEVRELLRLGEDPAADAAAVREQAAARLQAIRSAIAELTRQRDALAILVEACAGPDTARRDCPLLVDLWGNP